MKMKKILSLVALSAMMAMTGCGVKAPNTTPHGPENTANANGEVKEIGVIQIVQHDALDAANKGFVDALAEKGYIDGETINIDQQNAQNEPANAQTIAQQFVGAGKDLIFAIATPSAQAAYNATKDIPIVFTAVTDPVAAEIAKDWQSSGTNVTGTSDKAPVDKQLDLLLKLLPDTKTIGVIYNTSETNSEIQVQELEAAASETGLSVVRIGVTNANEISQNLTSQLANFDVLYTPTDNTVASAYSLVGKTCLDANKPIIGAEEAVVTKGGLATFGIDYYDLGKQAGYKAANILDGQAPSDITIDTLTDLQFTINTDVAAKLGITIPDDIKENAKLVTGGVE